MCTFYFDADIFLTKYNENIINKIKFSKIETARQKAGNSFRKIYVAHLLGQKRHSRDDWNSHSLRAIFS